jgi:4-deoxy-L-threo-5-hexosulose-uronate ketol-isomerase
MAIELRYLPDPIRCRTMTTAEMRSAFLLQNLFVPGKSTLVMVDVDRGVIGGILPTDQALELETPPEWRVNHFCDRREIGIINIGAAGGITVDGKAYALAPRDCLYIGRGSQQVSFTSQDAKNPAAFYLVSYPAHASYPTSHATPEQSFAMVLGTQEEANRRTLRRYIHEKGIKSCQLVMGYTELESGSMWNTMPAHTHERRSEIYMYFDMTDEARVIHLMGAPEESRHIVVGNGEAVVSPSWSMHAGVGTRNYRFVWAMGGENQMFEDMQGFSVAKLR